MPDHSLDSRHPQSTAKAKRHWSFWAAILVAALIVIWLLARGLTGSKKKPAATPAIPVAAAPVKLGDIDIYLDALGTVTPVYTVTVASRVVGELTEIHYKEGQIVKKNDLLAVIDPRPYRAALVQAQGQLQRDEALLKNARLDLTRYENSFKEHAIPQQQLATQQALVEQDEGGRQTRPGQSGRGQVNVDYTRIVAPIDGRVGLRAVDPGNIVPANGTTGLLTITQLQPITVIFTLAEDDLSDVTEQMATGRTLAVKALDRSKQRQLADGTLITVDNQVNTTTGTVRARATFPNTHNELFPNQFVNARLLVKTLTHVNLVPQAAIQRNNDVAFVYVIQEGGTVKSQNVTILASEGEVSAVTDVQPNDQVVTDGLRQTSVRFQSHRARAGRARRRGRAARLREPRQRRSQGRQIPAGRRRGESDRMNPSRPFILRPIATSLLMAAVLLIGIIGFRQLPIAALPEVDYPTMQVMTFYPGASADVVASAITAPLERQLGEVPGLSQMLSSSSDGASVITLQFNLSLNIDIAEQDVQEAINAAQNYLPSQLPMPPVYSKVNPADAPILTLALTSDSMPLSQVEDYTDTRLAEKISQLPGVGAVTISGGQKPAVRVQVNPTQLSSYGLNLEDVRSALTAASLDTAKGSFDGPSQSYQIGANDQITTSADYRKLVLAYRNGAPVMLTDVAKVVDGIENIEQSAWMNKVPGGDREHPAPARREHHRRGRQDQGAAAQAARDHSAGHQDRRAHRPHHHGARLGGGRGIRAGAVHRTRGHGDLRLPAHLRRHHHSQHRGAVVAGGHLRRHVRARLQPQQSDSDGAHHFYGVRGGRCHRHDREHHPLCRAGRAAAQSGAEGRGTDRLHHHVAHRLVDRGADSALVHGRHHRPPVPRVRGDVERDHPHFRRRLPDPHPHAVRAAAAAYGGRAAGPFLIGCRSGYSRASSISMSAPSIGYWNIAH